MAIAANNLQGLGLIFRPAIAGGRVAKETCEGLQWTRARQAEVAARRSV
jgi:hypothetical protein